MLVFEERGKPEKTEKNPRSKDENQQQTQASYATRPHWWKIQSTPATVPPLLANNFSGLVVEIKSTSNSSSNFEGIFHVQILRLTPVIHLKISRLVLSLIYSLRGALMWSILAMTWRESTSARRLRIVWVWNTIKWSNLKIVHKLPTVI